MVTKPGVNTVLASYPRRLYGWIMNSAEICEDKLLQSLPYRIESDRLGKTFFFDLAGEISQSRICPAFPKEVILG